jgi:signal transduction histidine kinase
MVLGKEGFLEAVVRNLLSNANKYSPRGAAIVVQVGPRQSNACVCVRDYGPGVSGERLESIFEPYFRDPALLDGTRGPVWASRCAGGRSRRWGRIWAEPAEGDGLRVCFTLPLAAESEAVEAVA